ncbi:hypothetical protein D3C81_1308000 [compost metagenome]
MALERLLQQLLQRLDHALLAQAQGLVLIQIAGLGRGDQEHGHDGNEGREFGHQLSW